MRQHVLIKYVNVFIFRYLEGSGTKRRKKRYYLNRTPKISSLKGFTGNPMFKYLLQINRTQRIACILGKNCHELLLSISTKNIWASPYALPNFVPH